jgi:LacI family transcriptional regulator
MTQRRASRLVDIAEAVGVHVSTVSRVLNGDPAQSIRPEVYEKILRTARQQGYRPNALARALKRRLSQRIGARRIPQDEGIAAPACLGSAFRS